MAKKRRRRYTWKTTSNGRRCYDNTKGQFAPKKKCSTGKKR